MIHGYLLKRPDSKRRTFQLVPYRRVDGKKVYGKPVESPELEALNQSYLSGSLNFGSALTELKTRIIPELKRRAGVKGKVLADAVISENNMRVFNEFWNEHYRRKRLQDKSVARNEFMQALKAFEPLSLHSSDIDVIQDHWDDKYKGTPHKRYGNRINQLLKHLHKPEIATDAATTPPLKYVTWSELQAILEALKHPKKAELKLLYQALWATGARLGELLVDFDVRENGTVYIHQQIDKKRQLKDRTKNGKKHDTVVLEEGLEATRAWSKVPDKASFRTICQHPLIDAAVAAFPTRPDKQISPHKLRHSYVKRMMEIGMPVSRIAQFLGDRTSTVETTYRQWVVSDVEIDLVREIMKQGYERLNKNKAKE